MEEEVLLDFIYRNNITRNTVLSIHLGPIDDQEEQTFLGKLEFLVNDHVAINDGRVGVKKQHFVNGPFAPIPGGVSIEDIIELEIA